MGHHYYLIAFERAPTAFEGDGIHVADLEVGALRARVVKERHVRCAARKNLDLVAPARQSLIRLEGHPDRLLTGAAFALAEVLGGIVTYPSFEPLDRAGAKNPRVVDAASHLIRRARALSRQISADIETAKRERYDQKKRRARAAAAAKRDGDGANDWSDVFDDEA